MKHALAALLLLFVFSPEAGAVLPSLVGPLQALISLLPQLARVPPNHTVPLLLSREPESVHGQATNTIDESQDCEGESGRR